MKLEDPATGRETPDRGPDDLNIAVSGHLTNGHQASGFGSSRKALKVPDEEPEPRFRIDLPLRPEHEFEGIIGCSSSLRQVVEQVKVVAPTNSAVLLLGETGTGKELFARAVHNLSARRDGPWIKVNCAAIPSGLLESELFGNERGAFTGALMRKLGRFELANGGTLFLDEIGDMPPELQPKLLRVLQEREFERLGSVQTLRADVRVVAATSRHLPEMVADGKFRSDLYYRLNVFPIRLPALRERIEDIQLLVMHFVQMCAKRMQKSIDQIPAETLHRLLSYSWPGNVRELQNFIERAVILTSGKVLRATQVTELDPPTDKCGTAAQSATKRALTLRDAERELIIQALAETNWVVGGSKGAAVILGLKRTTLISKMRRMRLSRALA
jgi:formate hydrogenlyase transcriptional activator